MIEESVFSASDYAFSFILFLGSIRASILLVKNGRKASFRCELPTCLLEDLKGLVICENHLVSCFESNCQLL